MKIVCVISARYASTRFPVKTVLRQEEISIDTYAQFAQGKATVMYPKRLMS